MNKVSYFTWMAVLVVLLLLTLPYIYVIFSIIFMNSRGVSILRQLSLYQWVAIGFISYYIFHHFIHKNIAWLETQSHEWSHSIVAMLFLRRIHSFVAEEGQGGVYTSGKSSLGLIPMTLAPYCLPWVSYLLLAVRPLIEFHGNWIFDILIGISLAFHCLCFKSQTGSYQTDINQYPLSFSFFYIWVARVINMLVIIVAFFPRYNVFTSFWRLVTSIFHTFLQTLSII